MKNSIVAYLLYSLCFFSLWQCSSALGTEIDIVPLRMDRVELALVAPVKNMDEQEMLGTFEEARKIIPVLSAAFMNEDDGLHMYIYAYSDKAEEARGFLEQMAREPFEKWEVVLNIHYGKLPKETVEDDGSKKQDDVEATHEEHLERRVKWRDDATIGDTLQTIADEFKDGASIEAGILAVYENDWQEFLNEPLKIGDAESTDDLTIKSLIDALEKQLKAEMSDCLLFDDHIDNIMELAPRGSRPSNRDVERD